LKPYIAGLAVTIAVIIGIWLSLRHVAVPTGTRDDAYAAQVAITQPAVAAAESMMGGNTIYYDGTLENHGDRPLSGYIVALTFTNPDGKPLQTVQRTLLDDKQAPLPPHASRTFEIGFDQTPAGWNQAPPSARAVAVYVR